MLRNALRLIETKGLIGAIEATDAAFLTIKIEGELGAVQAAVEAGEWP